MVTCPSCGEHFHPQEGPVNRNGSKFTCPNPTCQTTSNIVDTVRQQGKPREKLYAVQLYCPRCNEKRFAHASQIDLSLFCRAEQTLAQNWSSLISEYIPDTAIPPGFNTKQAMNHGYIHWRDMFNARQLLSLGILLRGILRLNAQKKFGNSSC